VRFSIVVWSILLPLCCGQSGPAMSPGRSLARVSANFEENRGQAAPEVRFLSRIAPGAVLFTRSEVLIDPGHGLTPLRLRMAGSAQMSSLDAIGAPSGVSSYFIGTQANWRTNIPTFARIGYRKAYPGIDLVFHGTQRAIEYDFLVAPRADPKRIEIEFSGATSLRLTADGDLAIAGDGFEILQHRPVVYQTTPDGAVQYVRGGYSIRGQNRIAFRIGPYDHARQLVIDPVITYSAIIGGSGDDVANAIATDSDDNAYVTGSTSSTDFPSSGLTIAPVNSTLAFVFKLNVSGIAIVYSALIGGGSGGIGAVSAGNAIAVDSLGNAYVAGATNAWDFPTTAGAFQSALSAAPPYADGHIFVLKLNPAGTALQYSTYLRGNYPDTAYAIAVDGSGNAYVTGSTGSSTFPTTPGSFQPGTASTSTAFVTKLNATGTGLGYSTYLGGNGDSGFPAADVGYAIAVDSDGNAYVAGSTQSFDFPTVAGSFETSSPYVDQGSGFVTKLNPAGSGLVYSTFINGSFVSAAGIALDASGAAYVAGTCTSLSYADLVSAGPLGTGDIFVLKLNAAGTAPSYLSQIGGSGQDSGTGIAVDASGNAYVSGFTVSQDFPLIAPLQSLPGTTDLATKSAVVLELNATGALTFSTYLGGQNDGDWANGIAVDGAGNAFVTGRAGSYQFPITPGAAGKTTGDGFNTFVTAINTTSGCVFSLPASSPTLPAAGGTGTVDISTTAGCTWIAESNQSWITFTSFPSGTGSGSVGYSVAANIQVARSAPVSVAGQNFTISQANGCTYMLNASSANVAAAGGQVELELSTGGNCPWTISTVPAWMPLLSGGPMLGSSGFLFNVLSNPNGPRSGTVTISGQSFTVNQAGGGAPCTFSLGPYSSMSYPSTGSLDTLQVTTTSTCPWTAVSNVSWLQVVVESAAGEDPMSGYGSGHVNMTIDANVASSARSGTITVASYTFTANQAAGSSTLHFVPVTPCRIADTRNADGPFGGPSIPASSSRDFAIPSSPCGIPANAAAYSLNLTVVPLGPLGFLSVWPYGQPQPAVSTLNSSDGRIKANAAIVPAGASGAITVFASDPTNVIVDINGYFIADPTNQALAFYPMTPCRIADTRSGSGAFGAPSLASSVAREFPIQQSACNVPANAQAYALNMTVVPSGALGFLSAWPAGSPQPGSSTLNAPTGTVVANAAIVPAGTGGGIEVIATNPTDLIIDINGYFAPPGGPGALSFYAVTPCRIMDTRGADGTFGGPILAAAVARTVPIQSSACNIPSSASAYSLNATVVPPAPLGFLSLWNTGGPQPSVSTLNAYDGSIVANAAIVPAGTGGAVNAFASNATQLILDINGYFAP